MSRIKFRERMTRIIVVHDNHPIYVRVWSQTVGVSASHLCRTARDALAGWMEMEKAIDAIIEAVSEVEGVTAVEAVNAEGDGEVAYTEWP